MAAKKGAGASILGNIPDYDPTQKGSAGGFGGGFNAAKAADAADHHLPLIGAGVILGLGGLDLLGGAGGLGGAGALGDAGTALNLWNALGGGGGGGGGAPQAAAKAPAFSPYNPQSVNVGPAFPEMQQYLAMRARMNDLGPGSY